MGRFAPSPTGPLHIGSLTTAVASYLHARQAGGEWLVRIEDIDPPREVPGAADSILRVLEALDLEWDRPVLYQSTRMPAYEAAAADLVTRGLAFACSCSRRDVREASGSGSRYPGTCRNGPARPGPTAVRVRVDGSRVAFLDGLRGRIERDIETNEGDYVIRRRDGLPAYHLAAVLDDAYQGVTHVVRGVDLLDSTGVHLHLQGLLGLPTPAYWHLPVVTNAAGQKLSKQTGACGITPEEAAGRAPEALRLLGLEPPRTLCGAEPRELWNWARAHWHIDDLAGLRALSAEAARSPQAAR